MEEIEELSEYICLMARIQPVDNTSDAGPSYDSAFISEYYCDDQIDSDIIFDSPNRNVNSGSIEKDTHVPDLCALEQLARNAYQEAEKQQIFAQKVQKQNMTLTSQLELYKEMECLCLDQSHCLCNSEISLNVRDTEDTLDDASKSQQKVYEKMNDPIDVANKQNCWTIDYAQINALYKDFVPQKELSKRLTVDTFDDLFDYLQQLEKLVNVSRAKKLEKSHDHLALVAHTGSSFRNRSSYYVTHPTSMVDYEDEYPQDDVHTNFEDPLTFAMLLLVRAITQNSSTLTNNRLR
ncbi:hypothetical protein Tco_1387570, partial [Tanacetum coccineum]